MDFPMLVLVKKFCFKRGKMEYAEELEKAMLWLAEKQDTIFLGQGIKCGGIAIAQTFKKIQDSKVYEMPIAENMQLGISTGLALNGFVPVSIYPRWNFLLLAADQLVNHLDKIPLITDGAYKPKVIIRVAVGVRKPVDPQEQHLGDFSKPFAAMLKTVNVVKLETAEEIMPAYKQAYEREDGVSTILVEQHQF